MKDNQERQDESDLVDEYLTDPPEIFDNPIQRFAETGEGYAEARVEIDKIIDDADSVEDAKAEIRQKHDFTKLALMFGESTTEATQALRQVANVLRPTPNMVPPKKLQGQKPQVVIVDEVKAPPKPEVKKPFVRKEHLTDRPFKDHPGLQALQEKQQADAKRAREARVKFKRRGAKQINPRAKRQR